jgi:phage-related tail fiber protein
LPLTHFAVGDGGDGYYDPDVEQTGLVNETFRGSIARISIDKNNTSRCVVECSIPADSGGYYIREIGIFASDGTLFAIGRLPESYKPVENEGSTRDFYIKVVIEVENENDMQLIVDSNVSIISYEYFENDHNLNPEAHYRLIDADKTDGYHAGNDEEQLAVSNGENAKISTPTNLTDTMREIPQMKCWF